MFDFARTRIEASREIPTSPLYQITSEGLALVSDLYNGRGVVRPSSGTNANEIFAGFSLAQNIAGTAAIQVEDLLVPANAPYTVALQQSPDAAANTLVKTSGTGVLTYNVAVGAGQFNLVNNVVTFNAAQAGQSVKVVYRYNLSALAAEMLYGDQPIGKTAASILNSVSVITKGVVFTDNYNTSDDYSTAVDGSVPVIAGANGQIQLGGTGARVTGRIVHVPTADVPFLGVYINV